MTITLWLPHRSDADRALALGMIARPYDDHVAVVHEVASSLAAEHEVEVVMTSVDELLAVIEELGGQNDPQGRATAAALIGQRRQP